MTEKSPNAPLSLSQPPTSNGRAFDPRPPIKTIVSYLIAFELVLITIDALQTVYGVMFLGFQELNPLGFPLGIAFAYGFWAVVVLECFIMLYLREKRPRDPSTTIVTIITFLLIGIMIFNSARAVTWNFLTLASP